ncbi:hypothetical protein MCEMSEM18_03668 [Comamonadaceae bacterium]
MLVAVIADCAALALDFIAHQILPLVVQRHLATAGTR